MTIWNKIVVVTKFFFGGFESATDYLIKILASFLESDTIGSNIPKAYQACKACLDALNKYARFCPVSWTNEYLALRGAIADCVDILADGKITAAELKSLKDTFMVAKSRWETGEEGDTGVDEETMKELEMGEVTTHAVGAIAVLFGLLGLGAICAGCQSPRATYTNGLIVLCSTSGVGIGYGQYAEVPAGGKFKFRGDTSAPSFWKDGNVTNSTAFAIDCTSTTNAILAE